MPKHKIYNPKATLWIFIIGVALFILPILIIGLMGKRYIPVGLTLITGFASTGGFVLLIIGIIRVILSTRHKDIIGAIFGGVFMIGLGLVLFLLVIRGEINGIAIYGGIPIPFIIIGPLLALAGIGIIITGFQNLSKKRRIRKTI